MGIKKAEENKQTLYGQQLKYLFIAFLGGTTGLIDYVVKYKLNIYPFGYISALFFILVIAYAIVRYRLMDIRVAISSAGIFLAVYALTLGVPFYLYTKGLHLHSLIFAIVLATGAPVIYSRLQRRAAETLLEKERATHDILLKASQKLTQEKTVENICHFLMSLLTRVFMVRGAAVFLYDGRKFALKARAGSPEKFPDDIKADSSTISYLKCFGTAMPDEVASLNKKHNGSGEVADFLRSTGASLALAILRQETVLGVILMSNKDKEQAFSDQDIVVLKVVASQAGMAIENAIHLARTTKTIEEEMHDHRLRDLGAIGSSISHQVGNRLQLVVRFLELFGRRFRKEVVDPATKEELIEKLNRSMDIFPEVIDSAIKAAEISDALRTQGKLSKEPQAVTLKRLVKMARSIAEAKHPSFKYEFVEEFDENLTLWVNESTLQDILFNLFDNSLDSIKTRMKSAQAPEGYVGRIRVAGQTEDSMSVIQVEDNGSGFRAEELKKAFVPFHTTKGSNKGTGLGLYVIQQFIRHSKGTIDVTSEPGAGAKFTIKLPLALEETVKITEKEA